MVAKTDIRASLGKYDYERIRNFLNRKYIPKPVGIKARKPNTKMKRIESPNADIPAEACDGSWINNPLTYTAANAARHAMI
jgi:hypothetical protein